MKDDSSETESQQDAAHEDHGLVESEQFTKVYSLPPGCRVEVSDIRGPVEVECNDTAEAEVNVVRRAASRADLAYHHVIVEQTATALMVGSKIETDDHSRGVTVRQHVRLRLPHRIALFIQRISGPLNIGKVGGPVNINSISGSVMLDGADGETILSNISGSCRIGTTSGRLEVNSLSGSLEVGRLTGYFNVSSVSGKVSAGIALLAANGLQLSNISGPVELFFTDEVNADLNIQHVSGWIHLELSEVAYTGGTAPSWVRARVGDGSSPVSISYISGPVRIMRLV
jgi:hypothetical protein